jgi:hypothetical protein
MSEDANFIAEVHPYELPSCTLCGAQMTPKSFRCLSCGSETGCVDSPRLKAGAEPQFLISESGMQAAAEEYVTNRYKLCHPYHKTQVDKLAYIIARHAAQAPAPVDWMEFCVKNMCSLCGQAGVIDTRGIRTPANFECGGLHYCICPNGRALKAGSAPKEEWLNQASPKSAKSAEALIAKLVEGLRELVTSLRGALVTKACDLCEETKNEDGAWLHEKDCPIAEAEALLSLPGVPEEEKK